jgi:hypothetical protein
MPRMRNILVRSRKRSLKRKTPEHHEGDDVGRILGPVQQAGAAFVELFGRHSHSGTGGRPWTVRSGRSETADGPHATHRIQLAPSQRRPYPAGQSRLTRLVGANADRTNDR